MRYLTPDEKAAHITDWMRCREEYAADVERAKREPEFYAERFGGYQCGAVDLESPDPLPGSGFPDPAVYALTDRLNAIDGICVVQSCSGHLHPGETQGMQAMWSGQLWLRVDESMAKAVTARAYELVARPQIEHVQRIFHESWGDLIDVIFDGMNRGRERFNESAEAIASFFECVVRDAPAGEAGQRAVDRAARRKRDAAADAGADDLAGEG